MKGCKKMNGLYKNIGDKVCKVAKFCGVLSVIFVLLGLLFVIIGINDYDDYLLFSGIATVAFGVVGVVASWPLYAFGQITNDIHAIRADVERVKQNTVKN
jgi:hypothetical protein